MSSDPALHLDPEEIKEHVQSLGYFVLTKEEREGLATILRYEVIHKVFARAHELIRNSGAALLAQPDLETPTGMAKALRMQGAATGVVTFIDLFFDMLEEEIEEDPEEING